MAESLRAADGFDVRGAIETIDRATSYDIPLRRRTEGVTWVLWGLVTAVIILSISTLANLPWWQPAYVPLALWPLLGLAGISAVWRIAALSAPALASDPGRVLRAALVAAVATVALGLLAWLVYAWTGTFAFSTGVFLALPWVLANAGQWRRMTDAGRRIVVVTGIVMTAGGAFLTASWVGYPGSLDYLGMAAIGGGIPLAVGLYRALTG